MTVSDRMDAPEGRPIAWRKSSYSSDTANCVEFARMPSGGVAVRDSKDPDGGILRFPDASWSAFIRDVCDGSLALPLDSSVRS